MKEGESSGELCDPYCSSKIVTLKSRRIMLRHVGFMVDEVALRQVFLPELQFSSPRIIPLVSRVHSSITDAL
jgi:hypothetical protein